MTEVVWLLLLLRLVVSLGVRLGERRRARTMAFTTLVLARRRCGGEDG